MARGRAPEDEQVEMFDQFDRETGSPTDRTREIRNFETSAKPGFESRHNLVYWSDQSFWGIGAQRPFLRPQTWRRPFGESFWNSKDLREYGLNRHIHEPPAGPIRNALRAASKVP